MSDNELTTVGQFGLTDQTMLEEVATFLGLNLGADVAITQDRSIPLELRKPGREGTPVLRVAVRGEFTNDFMATFCAKASVNSRRQKNAAQTKNP